MADTAQTSNHKEHISLQHQLVILARRLACHLVHLDIGKLKDTARTRKLDVDVLAPHWGLALHGVAVAGGGGSCQTIAQCPWARVGSRTGRVADRDGCTLRGCVKLLIVLTARVHNIELTARVTVEETRSTIVWPIHNVD